MGDVVNLNKFRKQKADGESEKLAKQNRTKFGRTKQQKKNDTLTKNKNQKKLSGKKILKPVQTKTTPTEET